MNEIIISLAFVATCSFFYAVGYNDAKRATHENKKAAQ